MSSSIPSARYTDKADGINVKSLPRRQAAQQQLSFPRRREPDFARMVLWQNRAPAFAGVTMARVDRAIVN
jgi:hypothetical protein